jgi:hypothetical protein
LFSTSSWQKRANIPVEAGAPFMNQVVTIKPDLRADRPIYTGMAWRSLNSKANEHWLAKSDTTPSSYIVEEAEEGIWTARHGFRDMPGRPHVDIGKFASMVVAMTACERHDFRFWASSSERAGLTCVFMGSPDSVSDFVGNLSEHDRDDLLDMIAGGYELPNGANFATTASYFPATKTGLKQERNGSFTTTLSVEAADLPTWMIQSQLGAKMIVGAVEVSTLIDHEWDDRVERALKRSFGLVQDNTFHGWLAQRYDRWGLVATAMQKTSEEVEKAVEETLRRLIGCPSRSDLATNRDAVLKLEKIDREYYLDMSRGFITGAASL